MATEHTSGIRPVETEYAENLNFIPTAILFQYINHRRRTHNEPEIDESLLASKLGILIAVKTDRYANFKQESVGLTGRQLIALESVLEEHFNVNLYSELHKLAQGEVLQPLSDKPQLSSNDLPTAPGSTLLNKVKGLFAKNKPVTQ